MSTYIGLQEAVFEVGNRQWLLASPKVKPNVTLDISKFNQTGVSAVQTVTVTTGSSPFTLSYLGVPTTSLPGSSTAAAVQAALQALASIGTGYEGLAGPGSSGYTQYPGAVSVTGPNGGPYVVTFQGALAAVDVAELTGTNVTVANTTAGVTAHYPNGYIPSGCALGEVTATGLYGPYDPTASDGRQTCKGFAYGDIRAVWIAGGVVTIADKVGTGLVVYDAIVSLRHLPFQGGPGSLDANGQAALPAINFQP
jgi:hypothetical protein